jgi:pimeloyl-ACP methyl ester carboxylesterase
MKPNPTELTPVDGSKDLFVFFGGIAAGIVIPPFEFYSAARILDASRLFIRDLDQCWYQTGVPSISRDINGTVQFIQDTRASLGAERLVLVGNSMGGFAALLFSSLIPDCRAVAFSPQTFISPLLRLWYRDARWYRTIAKAWRRSVLRPYVWDLLPLMRSRMPAANSATVFAASGHRLDRLHAERLHGVPGVTVRLLDGDTHNVVKSLRDRGELPAIIAGADGATDSPCRSDRTQGVA